MSSKIFQFSFGDGYAGSAKVAILSSELLMKKGYEVKLFVSKNSLTRKRSVEKKIDLISLDTTKKFSSLFNEIVEIFNVEKPQIIISHHSLDRKIGFKLKRKFGKKFINIGYRHNITKSAPIIGAIMYNHYYDYLIACSKGVEKSLINSGIKQKKVKVIYNGIDLPKDLEEISGNDVKKNLGIENRKVLGLSSWFHKERKGFDILFKAFSKLTEKEKYVLLIMGIPSKDKDAVFEYASEFGIDKTKIIMPGYVDNIWHYYKAMNIFLLPSRSEGFSLSLLEAAASKLPIIASDIPGTNEFIQDGWNGLLFDTDSPESLADKIEFLVLHNSEAEVLSKNAYNLVMSKFLIEHYAEKLSEFFLTMKSAG